MFSKGLADYRIHGWMALDADAQTGEPWFCMLICRNMTSNGFTNQDSLIRTQLVCNKSFDWSDLDPGRCHRQAKRTVTIVETAFIAGYR